MYFSAGDQKEADETTGLVFFDLAQVNNLDNRYYIIHFSSKLLYNLFLFQGRLQLICSDILVN